MIEQLIQLAPNQFLQIQCSLSSYDQASHFPIAQLTLLSQKAIRKASLLTSNLQLHPPFLRDQFSLLLLQISSPQNYNLSKDQLSFKGIRIELTQVHCVNPFLELVRLLKDKHRQRKSRAKAVLKETAKLKDQLQLKMLQFEKKQLKDQELVDEIISKTAMLISTKGSISPTWTYQHFQNLLHGKGMEIEPKLLTQSVEPDFLPSLAFRPADSLQDLFQ